ncbi:hypothetical protein [Microbacterium sp. MPKO10]|uniref:hypothetical protein n=1 Tax=Microbacterium sp. MPKO10 TaxID=2989818 RepID=UPI0022354AD5|nr:hypothetical protein [Microbacterium sp. MPKO10]MCW4459425.1 hypothetical protein [Microbacterium sp. MPKO10]
MSRPHTSAGSGSGHGNNLGHGSVIGRRQSAELPVTKIELGVIAHRSNPMSARPAQGSLFVRGSGERWQMKPA